MPSATRPRNVLARQSWRDLRQERQNSTAQESRPIQEMERTSAMLHGKRGQSGSTIQEASSRTISQNRSTHAANATSQRSPAKSQQTTSPQSPPRHSKKQQRPEQRILDQFAPLLSGKKRKADQAINQRPARRRRDDRGTARLQLKDEAFIRKTMRVPTPEEYPNLSRNFFKEIKSSIHNATQGFAEIQADTRMLTGEVFQTTLHFKTTAHDEVVVGEGRSKVMMPELNFFDLLTIKRWLPPMRLICTSWPNFTSKAFLRMSSTKTPS